jgi:hypothetical protein
LVFEAIYIWVVGIEVVEVCIEIVVVGFVEVVVPVVLLGFIIVRMVSFDFYQVNKTNNFIKQTLVDPQQSYLLTFLDV